ACLGRRGRCSNMPGRALAARWILVAGLAFGASGATAHAAPGEDSRTAEKFLKELRDRGFHDLALDFIRSLREDPQLPSKVKDVLDYEEGRTLIDEASKSGDLVLRDELLRDAAAKLEGFANAHPQLMQARDAQVQMGKLLLRRGHTAILLSEEARDAAKKDAKTAEARAAFGKAKEAYGKTIEPLKAVLENLKGYIDKDDPRAAERDAAYSTILDARLQQAVADYELAQTYPAGSPERAKS